MELVPTIVDLSPNTYFIVFAIGASVLAMWFYMRFPSFGPEGVTTIAAHMAAAVLGAHIIVPTVLRSAAGSHEQMLAATFAVVLPLVVYMFLSAIWLIRFGQGLLRRYSNN